MNPEVSSRAIPRRIRMPHRGLSRPLDSWRHAREIFDPSTSYYLTFLFGFYFGYVLIIFFMVVSSFSPSRGFPLNMNQFMGSESINRLSRDVILADPLLVKCEEINQGLADHEGIYSIVVLRSGDMTTNGRGTSPQKLLEILSQAPPGSTVVLQVDPDATHGDLVRTIDLLHSSIQSRKVAIKDVRITRRIRRGSRQMRAAAK